MWRKQRKFSLYPVWVGVGAVALLWLAQQSFFSKPSGKSTSEAVSLAEDAAVDSPGPAPITPWAEPHLTWRIVGRPLPSADELNRCFSLKHDEIQAVTADDALIFEGTQSRLFRRADGLWLETLLSDPPSAALMTQVKIAECLRNESAELVDEDSHRRFRVGQWPARRASGGLSVGDFVEIAEEQNSFVTSGLARFGMPEMVAFEGSAAQADDARLSVLWQAIATAIFSGKMPKSMQQGDFQAKIELASDGRWHFSQIAVQNPSLPQNHIKKTSPTAKKKKRASKSGFLPDYR